MSTRALRLIAIILPTAFWLLVLLLRTVLFAEQRTAQGDIFAIAAIALGAIVFANWIFRVIENRESEIKRRSEQLSSLHSAALTLTTELDLGTVLQKVIDLARPLVHAQYGALGVLDEKGEYITQFLTSGITLEQRAMMGVPPRGHGLLGALILEAKPIRLPEIAQDIRSVGFPSNHPEMHSFLGVPIRSKGKVIGNLYMTNKMKGAGIEAGLVFFTELDQQVLEMFATQAAIAIENAQLYRQTQQLAVLKERERFGMDLHDGIIQSVYAVGLMLEDSLHRIGDEPSEAKNRIERAIHELNDVIRDIRNYILDLRPLRFQGRDLRRGLEELTRGLRANTLLNVSLHMDSMDVSQLSAEQTVEILHIVQETLTNVRKHARANNVDISLGREGADLWLRIKDDGIGFGDARAVESTGHGLKNMRERAMALHGEIHFERNGQRGTVVLLRLPLI
jgi:two-component system, NarL family, sensor histidine kinase DevS